MAHESPNPWSITLPSVLLGIRSAIKKLLGRSAVEMVYSMTLARRIYRKLDSRQTYRLSRLLRQVTGSHVVSLFLWRISISPPLTAPYDGPYKVVSKSDQVLKLLMKGKVEMVTANRVKPAHIELEPEICNTQQRQTQPKPISMTKKPAAIILEPRTARARTPKSGTRVNSDKSTNTRSSTLGVGTGLAIAPQSNAARTRAA